MATSRGSATRNEEEEVALHVELNAVRLAVLDPGQPLVRGRAARLFRRVAMGTAR